MEPVFRALLKQGRYVFTYRTAETLHRIYDTNVPFQELLADQRIRNYLKEQAPQLLTLPAQELHRPLRELAMHYNPSLAPQLDAMDAYLKTL